MIDELSGLGAIVPCADPHWLSAVFLVPKPQSPGEYRLIHDMRDANRLMPDPPGFSLEDLRLVASVASKGDWGASTDLQHAYFGVGIFVAHQPLLAFEVVDRDGSVRCWQWTVLPFGWSHSPFLFVTFMRPVLGFLRRWRVTCLLYLDDLILFNKTAALTREDVHFVLSAIAASGLLVKERKSLLEPAQQVPHLGQIVDLEEGRFILPEGKVRLIQARARALICAASRRCRWVPRRGLESFLGLVAAVLISVTPARLHSRHLHTCLATPRSPPWSCLLSRAALSELQWWAIWLPTHRSAPIWHPPPTRFLTTDASTFGLGAVLHGNPVQMAVPVAPSERHLHITALETRAVLSALRFYDIRDCVLELESDSSVVVSCLRKWGSRSVAVHRILCDIFDHCALHRITLLPRWCPSALNCADPASRVWHGDSFSLLPHLTSIVFRLLGRPRIDLFACPATAVCRRFWAAWPAHGVEGVDALSVDWEHRFAGHLVWCFPPPSLLLRALHAFLASSTVTAIFIVPLWAAAPWWPLLFRRRHRALRLVPPPGGSSLVLPESASARQRQVLLSSEWLAFRLRPRRC
jgi:hypothetical protein